MACDNLCGFKLNGWHDTACPESDDSKKAYAMATNPKYWVDFDNGDLCRRDGSAFAWLHADHCEHEPEELEEIHRFLSAGEEMEATIKTLHAALVDIAEIEVNDNSEPEAMGMALNKIRLIARTALQEGN